MDTYFSQYKKRELEEYAEKNNIECNKDEHVKRYDKTRSTVIKTVYIVAIAFWIFILLIFGIPWSIGTLLIGIIPIITFCITILSVDGLTAEVENDLTMSGVLSLGVICVIPLIVLVNKGNVHNKMLIITLMITSIAFAMISVIDEFVPIRWISVVKHIKSIFRTYSIALLLLAIVLLLNSDIHGQLKIDKIN